MKAIAKRCRTRVCVLAALAAATLIAACASQPRASARTHTATAAGTSVRIFAAGQACTSAQPDITGEVADSARGAKASFKRFGFDDVEIVSEPTGARLLEEVATPRATPLIVFVAGHGLLRGPDAAFDSPLAQCPERGGRCTSAICLADGKALALDEVVEAVSERTPFALLMVDACTSAHVDLRNAKTDVSVISVTPVRIDILTEGQTVMSDGLARVSENDLDGNCDGRISDLELFEAWSHAVQKGNYSLAQPKLRRQLRQPGAVLERPAPAGCIPPPASGEREQAVAVDPMADDEGVRVLGAIEHGATIEWSGRHALVDQLIPMACEDEVGQCFRIR